MFAVFSAPLWHSLLATSAVTGVFGLAMLAVPSYANPDSLSETEAIRPFQVAITVFPEDVYRPPETWARRAYRNLIYFHEVDKGGHFAAWEQPQLFATEIRAAFKSLRSAGGTPAVR